MGFISKAIDYIAKEAVTRVPWVKTTGVDKTYGRTSNFDFEKMVTNYKSWPYACANRNAYSVAKMSLDLYHKTRAADGTEENVQIYDHIFLDLLNNVNPFFNKFELWSLTVIFLELTGNAYWWMPKNGLGVPECIWVMPTPWTKIVPDENKFIKGYVVTPPSSGKGIPFEEDEVVHFKYPSPFSLYYGASPLMAAAYSADLNTHSKQWGISYFMNNAQPSGVLQTKNTLTPDAYRRLQDNWNRKHRGSSKAGKIAILEQELQYMKIGSDMGDMAFPELSRMNRDEILAIMGVPASKLGLVEDVNRANAEANDYTYQKETIVPKQKLIEEKINEKVMPIYDTGLYVEFESPVPEDKEFRLRERTEGIRSGYSSIDDERLIDDKEPYELPETQTPLIPFSVTPAGTIEATDPNPAPVPEPEPASTDSGDKAITKGKKMSREAKWNVFSAMMKPLEKIFAKTMETYFREQHSIVMQNINRFKSMGKAANEQNLEDDIMFNMNEQNAKLVGKGKPVITQAFSSGAELAAAEMGISFDLIEPAIVRAVDPRIDFFAKSVNETTLKLIKKNVTAGLELGETIDEIAARLDKIYDFRIKHSSKLTSQTEVIGASNEGQLYSYKEAGVEEKEWLTAMDEKVRSSHRGIKNVKIDEAFITGNGNRLLYPGDRSSGASASDVINCRCTVIGVFKD